jgi:hypothetical protein
VTFSDCAYVVASASAATNLYFIARGVRFPIPAWLLAAMSGFTLGVAYVHLLGGP